MSPQLGTPLVFIERRKELTVCPVEVGFCSLLYPPSPAIPYKISPAAVVVIPPFKAIESAATARVTSSATTFKVLAFLVSPVPATICPAPENCVHTIFPSLPEPPKVPAVTTYP